MTEHEIDKLIRLIKLKNMKPKVILKPSKRL